MAYYGADMVSVETFMEDRIKRGMGLAPELRRMLGDARATEHSIRFNTMDLRAKWARQKSAFKQDGYALILADEVSTWPSFAADMLRKRADMYPFHHILFISSPDPARKGNPDQDPICVLYEETDKCAWMMPDPAAPGKEFCWQFSGLRWPEHAKHGDEWDLDMVRAEAHYVTPHGTVISNDQRQAITATGRWVSTAKSSRDDVRGIKVVAPMIPTSSGDFGELAARFLSAKYRLRPEGTAEERLHNPIRVYFAEYWAEAYREEQVQVHDATLAACVRDYDWGQVPCDGGQFGIFVTVDVQKFHLWWLARAWHIDGDEVHSYLIDYGNAASMHDLDDAVGQYNPALVGIDIGYALRQSEVADWCASYTDNVAPRDARVIALRGSEKMQKSIIDMQIRDALEGRRAAGGTELYAELTWNTDVFRDWLIEYMETGDSWHVPREIANTKQGLEYIRQATTTSKVDGEWVGPKHRQDHLFDCEAMQMVLARYDQLIS